MFNHEDEHEGAQCEATVSRGRRLVNVIKSEQVQEWRDTGLLSEYHQRLEAWAYNQPLVQLGLRYRFVGDSLVHRPGMSDARPSRPAPDLIGPKIEEWLERNPEYSTRPATALRVGVHPRTIGRWVDNGKVGYKIVEGRQMIFLESAELQASQAYLTKFQKARGHGPHGPAQKGSTP